MAKDGRIQEMTKKSFQKSISTVRTDLEEWMIELELLWGGLQKLRPETENLDIKTYLMSNLPKE